MIQRSRRWMVLFLLAGIFMLLTACGRQADATPAAQTDQTVYVPKIAACQLPLTEINAYTGDGQRLYLAGKADAQQPGVSGEADAAFQSRPALYRLDVETGAVSQLPHYAPVLLPEEDEGSYYVSAIAPGADDTLWITETVDEYQFDLPDGFDEQTESKLGYITDIVTTRYCRHLRSTGEQIRCIDLSELSRQLEFDSIQSITADGDGYVYVVGDLALAVLTSNLEPVFSLQSENALEQPILLADGRVGIACAAQQGRTLRSVDTAAKDWGQEYPLPDHCSALYAGTGGWLFFGEIGESLYAYAADAREGRKLLSWSAADIDRSQVEMVSILPDARVAALQRTDTGEYERVLLTPVDASAVPEKTVLTFATLSLDYDTRMRIIDFNRRSEKYRIEIQDYSEYDTGGDAQAGLMKLNTQIAAGDVPDILDTSGNLPLRVYAAKGLLEDLWPYIEKDPALGRKGVMERVFHAAEIGGKLYQVFRSFTIETVVGAEKVVGKRMGWTLQQLQAALRRMPEGCQIFDQYDTKDSILNNVLRRDMDKYVDWASGTCRFDSEGFVAALEFCNSFPMQVDETAEYEPMPDRVSSGRQMLLPVSLNNFTDLQMYKAVFGGAVSFIGYPAERGNGSCFGIGPGMAMSKGCADKEAAWQLLRQMLLPQEDDVIFEFPTNRAAFVRMAKESMTATYLTDETGAYVLDDDGQRIEASKGSWAWDTLEVELKAVSRAEYNQIMALYDATGTTQAYDETIFSIVSETVAAYFNGDRTARDTAKLIQGRAQLYVWEQQL